MCGSNRHCFGALALVYLLALGCHSASRDRAVSAPDRSGPDTERATASADRAAPNANPSGPGAGNVATSAGDSTRGVERVVRITAKKFEYSPASITLKKGEPVVLELVSLDRVHGFDAPDFGLRADIKPDASTQLRFVPEKVGTFEFHCDVFCGSGHEEMIGEIIVHD